MTLNSAGKAMREEGATGPLALAVALQGRVTGAAAAGKALQAPAVAAVTEALAQHAHAPLPGVSSAEEAQQQPPRQAQVGAAVRREGARLAGRVEQAGA